jgi:hypothetical protein
MGENKLEGISAPGAGRFPLAVIARAAPRPVATTGVEISKLARSRGEGSLCPARMQLFRRFRRAGGARR